MVKGTKKEVKSANKKVTATKKPVKAAKTVKKPVKKETAVKSTKKNVKAVKTANKTVKRAIPSKEYEVRKDFIKAYGFETVSDFATALGDDIANTTKVLKGIQKPSIEKMIKYAITLNAGLGDIINLFYPKEMQEYKKKHNKKKG